MAESYSDDKETFNFDCFISDDDLFSKDDICSTSNEISETNVYKYEMKELQLEDITCINSMAKYKKGKERARCDSESCIRGNISLYLCYVCNTYLCKACLRSHDEFHEFVRIESDDVDRRKKAEMLVGIMRSENSRELSLHKEDIRIYARVNVNHEFDTRDCVIIALCGLQNRRWVALDNNYCMKVFCSVTNSLLKYVRFGSLPRDVTEIKILQNVNKPVSSVGNTSTTRSEAKKDYVSLLAVTFPSIKEIWFLDVNQTPVIKTKVIKMEIGCWFIEFSEEKIFTFCMEEYGSGYQYSVYILSSEGKLLKILQRNKNLFSLIPDLSFAVNKGYIYATDYYTNKVFFLDVENGETCFQLQIKDSRPRGICVDPKDNVYMCGENYVYKLSPDLQHFEDLGVEEEFARKPTKLCFTDDKIFIGNKSDTSNHNLVTVIQVT